MNNTEIKILQPGNEAALEKFLLPRISTSMFLLGNMRDSGLTDRGRPYQGTYTAAFEAGEMVGVVAHYWNGNLIFQAPAQTDALWRAAVESSARPIRGLLGPDTQVAVAKQSLRIDESVIQLDDTDKLYSLPLENLVVPNALQTGKVIGRRITAADLDLVTRWRVGFSVEGLGEADTPQLRQRCRQSIERSCNEGRTWVLEAGGQPVACTSFNTAIKEAVQVGGVWTPPKYRRRGYGRAVVAASLLDACREGAEISILFTAQNNIAAQKAYESLGYRHIGNYRLLLLSEAI